MSTELLILWFLSAVCGAIIGSKADFKWGWKNKGKTFRTIMGFFAGLVLGIIGLILLALMMKPVELPEKTK